MGSPPTSRLRLPEPILKSLAAISYVLINIGAVLSQILEIGAVARLLMSKVVGEVVGASGQESEIIAIS
jgi:hypothetical protein